MACKTSYDLHHNFPRLAEETGFAFNTHRPRIHIDWNKIRLIDIDSLTRDRKFILIEQHVNDILDCVLESEFDVRILDEGVVKLFRLAQLAVEYQQFCRHYLDRSVFVLRQEIDTLAQELANAKKDLQEKEEELRKLRRKGKSQYKSLLPYGNDNIAAMILKTLTNKGDIFASNTNGEVPQYNKCNYCDKVFLNQLYLKSHISRRHANHLEEPPQREVKEPEPTEVNKVLGNENDRLNDEINLLKLKIKEMEILITNNNKVLIDNETTKNNNDREGGYPEKMKVVEVYASNDDVFQRLEEWKRTEQANHMKEINLLRNQIFETLNNLQAKEIKKPDEMDSKIVDQLNTTIKDQGEEILSLKQSLAQSKFNSESEDQARKREIEEQMIHWAKRDEAQSKKYEILVQKLNEVAQEARESRALAEAERHRAGQLEALLKQRLGNKHLDSDGVSVFNTQGDFDDARPVDEKRLDKVSKPVAADHNSLEQLHRKAQELLNLDSSTTSDVSSPEKFYDHHPAKLMNNRTFQSSVTKGRIKKYPIQLGDGTLSKKSNKDMNITRTISVNKGKKVVLQKQEHIKMDSEKKPKNEKPKASRPVITMQQNGPVFPPSPLKVVRAKITEEVNNRLVQAGVDPLKSRLNHNVFQKQKTQLQQQLDFKSKKYPAYEQVRYTIMAYLDSDASSKKVGILENRTAIATPNALSKAFSLSSMISNVKSKALSLVKNKDTKRRTNYINSNADVTTKEVDFIKTPPESPVSPTTRGHDSKFSSRREYEMALEDKNHKTHLVKRRTTLTTQDDLDSDSDESPPDTIASVPQRPARSIDNLIMSPARRPSSANADYGNAGLKYTTNRSHDDHLLRTQSDTNILEFETDNNINEREQHTHTNDKNKTLLEINKNPKVDNNRSSPKQAKSVLKNASSTSSLNKKKVIFDMDAIQMKSVSASPSQSLTEKSDDKYELGLINIGDDEWDISSIENEPIKNETKIRVSSGQSPKIAELKQTIEAQLARRSETPSTALFGGVDVLRGPKSSNIGGSNTSLGSSILDDSDSAKGVNRKPISIVKPKNNIEKEDSELDISDFSVDGVTNKNEKDYF